MSTELELAQAAVETALAKSAEIAREQRDLDAMRDDLLERVPTDGGQLRAIEERLRQLLEEERLLRYGPLASLELAVKRQRGLLGEYEHLKKVIAESEQTLAGGGHDVQIGLARLKLQMLEAEKESFNAGLLSVYERIGALAGDAAAQELAKKHGRVL